MYSPIEIEGAPYQLKPMNCPFHITIYKLAAAQLPRAAVPLRRARHRLPLRALGRAARPDARARLHPGRRAHLLPPGPARGRDRAGAGLRHRRCSRPSASTAYDIYLSTRPANASGHATSSGRWRPTRCKQRARRRAASPYEVDPGEGAFYGPKIDIKIKDSLGRAWQCSTIQVDFHNPSRFELEYIGEDGKRAPAGDGPPRAARQPGAVLRRADRALRAARSRCGWRRCRRW